MRYRHNPAVSVTEVDGDTFLVAPGTEEVFYLDAVTSGLWRMLAEPRSLAELLAAFRAAFPERAAEEVDRDVAAAFDDLLARGLIVSVP